MSIWHLVLSKVKRKDVLRLGSLHFFSTLLLYDGGLAQEICFVSFSFNCRAPGVWCGWKYTYRVQAVFSWIPCPIVQLSKCPFDHFIVGKNAYLTCRLRIFIWKNHNDLIKMTVMNKNKLFACIRGWKKSKLLFGIHLTKPLPSIRGNYFLIIFYFMQLMCIQSRHSVINWT